MSGEIKVVPREEILVMARRLRVRPSEGPIALPVAFGAAYAHLERLGAGTAGPPFAIYHGWPAGDGLFDADLCIPIAAADTTPADGWRVDRLPAGTFATAVHVGSYDSLDETYDRVREWIEAHAFAVSGPPREVYLSGPGTPEDETRTIVEFPVSEAPVLVPA